MTDTMRVSTIIAGDIIAQRVDIAGEIRGQFLDTADRQARDALIELGWTPPSDWHPIEEHDGAEGHCWGFWRAVRSYDANGGIGICRFRAGEWWTVHGGKVKAPDLFIKIPTPERPA